MRPLTARALFLLALAGPVQAGQVEAPVSGEFSPGSRPGGIGSVLGTPVPISMAVPTLTAAGAPLAAPLLAPAPILVSPAALQAAPIQPAAIRPAALPALPASAVTPAKPKALAERTLAAPDASVEPGVDPGRALFDQGGPAAEAAPAAGGMWGIVKNLLAVGEAVPAWPGKAGDVVRIGKIKTKLDRVAGDGGTSKVWRSSDRNYAIKILHPGAREVPGVREEAATLRAIAKTDLPVAKLLAESRDGLVLVKEFIEGDTAHQLLERGAFSRTQAEGWPELAARLLKARVTADLAQGNLVWQHWRTRWVVVDAGSLTDGSPREVLDQMLDPVLLARAGMDPVAFLSGLRARLGPDSALWAQTAEGLRGSKAGAPALAGLARRDEAPAGPVLKFGPAAKGPPSLDDSVVAPQEVAKRLGYDPLLAKTKIKLHGEDPGKLNTTILSVDQPGKAPVVVKLAQWSIIRNEVLLRRLARRFFGAYFRTPASVAVNRGHDSYMVMERAEASAAYYGTPLTLEQRVAAAVFIHTFGVSDVNPGNVLTSGSGGLPWLIDFEQALGRVSPNAGRIPDERIALEMPWMSRQTPNRVEDYQPGVRAWRAFLKKPETRAAILSDLAAAGFGPADAAGLLARFDLNAADLDWTLQNDADFVNQFVDRNAAQR